LCYLRAKPAVLSDRSFLAYLPDNPIPPGLQFTCSHMLTRVKGGRARGSHKHLGSCGMHARCFLSESFTTLTFQSLASSSIACAYEIVPHPAIILTVRSLTQPHANWKPCNNVFSQMGSAAHETRGQQVKSPALPLVPMPSWLTIACSSRLLKASLPSQWVVWLAA
jgi:hypothetical protein